MKLPNINYLTWLFYAFCCDCAHNFDVSLDTTLRLKTLFPQDSLLVTESGIHSAEDVKLMLGHDIHAFLIGEQFMKTGDAGQALAKLLAQSQQNA